jgi:hypothetical protein
MFILNLRRTMHGAMQKQYHWMASAMVPSTVDKSLSKLAKLTKKLIFVEI